MKKLLSMVLALAMVLGAVGFSFAESGETRLTEVLEAMRTGEGLDAVFDRFTDEMKQVASVDSLGALWSQLAGVAGEFVGYEGETAVAESGDSQVLTQTVAFQNMNFTATMVVDGNEKIAGLNIAIAQEPAAPDEHVLPENVMEEEVTVGETPWELGGTLSLPTDAAEKLPAVVLVQGSGASDRNESAYAVTPFRDVSDALASAGVAVLRYDKRTYVYGQEIASAEDFSSFSVEQETIEDAIAAGKLLAADPRIDAGRIYVMGHSLGAMMAPRIVSESNGVFAGMILACGTDKTLLDIMLRQNESAINAMTDENTRAAYAAQLDEVKTQADGLVNMTAEEAQGVQIFGQPAFYFWEMAQKPTASAYMVELQLPALIINGSRDFQVTTAEGQETWEQVLDMDATWLTTLWTDVNHMLMKPEVDEAVAGTTAEYQTPCTVDMEITSAIAAFILTNGGK